MPALGTHPLATDVVFAEQFSSGGFPRVDDTGNWTIALFNGAVYDAGGYLLLDGDAFARVADNLNLTYPFTMACEVFITSSGGMPLSATWADDNYVYLASQSGQLAGQVRAGGGSNDVALAGGLPGSAWIPVAIICASATSLRVWQAGTLSSEATTSMTPSGTSAEYFTIGALSRGGGADSNHMPNGSRIRNVIVWQGATNGAMTDAKLDEWAADPSLPYSGGGDTTPPTLTSPTGTGGVGVCSGTVSTDEGNGTLYAVATASSTQPSVAQIKAGQDHTGDAALRVVSQAVTTTGTQTISSGAISGGAGMRYWHFVHTDAAGNDSNRVSSASFEVTAAATQIVVNCPDAAGVTGISGVVLSASAPGTGVTVIKTISGASFNGSGVLTIDIAGLGVNTGVYRWVDLTNSNGNPSQSPPPFGCKGPVITS